MPISSGPVGPSAARRVARVLLPLCCTAFILFIFYNSSQPGPASSSTSHQVATWVTGGTLAPQATKTVETVVRKLAHVGEYALLGMLLGGAVAAWGSRHTLRWALPAGLGLLVAAADEAYQRTVPGRSGQLSDVLIDLVGVALGLGLLFAVGALRRRARRKG